jgi:transcriptional regulator GlxA family with amidase domain
VGVLAYDGCFAAEVFGLTDLFVMADRLGGATGISANATPHATVLGAEDVATAAGGHRILCEPLDTPVDVIVVPGFDLSGPAGIARQLEAMHAEVSALRAFVDGNGTVASVCVGAFVLGEAGLLDGRRATTSWLFADLLRQRFPGAVVDADAMVVSDGPVTTTAAFSAVHDLALRFIRASGGDALARHVARMTLVADNRHSQSPYVDESLLPSAEDPVVRGAKRFLLAHLGQPYELSSVAAAVHVSTRTLLRRFAACSGRSPLAFLQASRMEAAKRLLESPDHDVASAMRHVGYLDRTAFRKLFIRHCGMTPGAYKAQFQSSPQIG